MEGSDESEAPHVRVQLEVWSDVACPWCYLGRRNLGIALADVDARERPEVVWRAYQIDPAIPAEGADADAYWSARFGADLGRLENERERLVALGEELGIHFRFDRQRSVPNTHLAHRVLQAAAQHGEREPLMDAIFAAYFERGVDISSEDHLRELITEQLVDRDLARDIVDAALRDPAAAAAVDSEIAAADELGITGVPCFVADRRIAVPGAVPAPVLAQLLAQAFQRADDPGEEN